MPYSAPDEKTTPACTSSPTFWLAASTLVGSLLRTISVWLMT